jgi:tRNA(Arg) A34 adenosine deaminase TadA
MNDKDFLHLAIEQAKESMSQGGFPAGSVLVKNGKITSKGVSLGYALHDPTSHSDTAAIREACKVLQTTDLTGATLYSSVQPCLMCFSVTNWAGVSRIVFGCKKTPEMVKKNYYEGTTDIFEVNKNNTKQIELLYIPDFEQEMRTLIVDWERKINLPKK